ncbi:hypothetical protein ACIGQE_15325 [Streptomyces sp. NPDC053429]|uniref:hypothetical protein n=1 Tax=Streptomyces sp. NPDC053429 TaxID=3365702 RepID=UPI0037D5491F
MRHLLRVAHTVLLVFFAAATAAGFAGLCLAAPARARDLYAAPALGTCAFIVLLAALGAALL